MVWRSGARVLIVCDQLETQLAQVLEENTRLTDEAQALSEACRFFVVGVTHSDG
jgi:hypothetical protein